MKNYFIVILLLSFGLSKAQEDNPNLQGEVKYIASRNDGVLNKKVKKKLVFTSSHSVFFSPLDKGKRKTANLKNSKPDSLKKKVNKSHSGANYNVIKTIDKILYTDLKDRQIVHQKGVFNVETKKQDGYILTEKIPDINWAITNKFKEISSFKAQKATCHFRGRDYTVWFTPEIPVPFGPWKLQGLPGLILSASDKQGDVVFYAKSVNIPYELSSRQKNQLKLNKDFKKLSLKTFIKEKRKEEKRKKKAFDSRLGDLKDGETMSQTTYKGFPIEKDYKDLFEKQD